MYLNLNVSQLDSKNNVFHNDVVVLSFDDAFRNHFVISFGGREFSDSIGYYHPYSGDKDIPLTASEIEIFRKLFSSDFNPGLNGFAFTQDEWGRWLLEVDRIVARESLTVPEFVKNRITVANNQTWFTDNGIVETVAEVSGNAGQRIITIAEDKGGACTFQLDDLLKGIYLDEIDGGLSFQTVRMTVLEVITPYALRVSVDESTPPPREELIIVRTGNRTNPERQNSIFMDGARPAMFYYVNVDSHLITERNIAHATGNLRGLNFGELTGNLPIQERFSSIMRGDNYIAGHLVQMSGNGLEYPLPADRGAWIDIPMNSGVRRCYHYDRVSHNGSMWDCAVAQTTAEPSATATDWTERVKKGADGKDVDPEVLKDILDAQLEQQTRINDWASDAKISPPEKTGLKDQHKSAIAEKTEIDADAARYALTATVNYISYVTASSKAFAAWSKYSAALPENITLTADYGDIAAYYTARTAIKIDIAAAAKMYTDNVQVGGVNLINNSTINATGDVLNGFTFWKHLSTALVPGKSYIFSSTAPLVGVTKFAVTPIYGSGAAEQTIAVNTPFTANAAHKSIYAVGPLAGNVGVRVQLESGNRATDWSPSPDEIRGEITAAKAIADQAKADVTTQGDRLTQWASDSVVSPPEKMSLKDQHNAAIQEKISIDADAAKYGLTATTAYTQYVSGASAAFATWNKYTQSIPENITIGADYGNIAAYYKFRSSILTAISDKVSKDYSDSIQIGGVNLILKSIVSAASPAGYTGFIGWWTLRQLLVPGKTYVFSTNIKPAELGVIAVAPTLGSGTGQQVIVPNVPFVANALHRTVYMTGNNANNIGYVVQLEDGNKVTPWSSCPDDLKAEIDDTKTIFSSQIASLDSKIALKVSQTDFNSLGSRVSVAESSITVNSNNIALKVSKDGIISSINQTPEAVKISADRIILDGNTIARIIESEHITTSRLTVTSGAKIGGFKINGSGLSNESSRDEGFIEYNYTPANCYAGIGSNVFEPVYGLRAMGRFSNGEYNPYDANFGIFLDVWNGEANKNHAIYIRRGMITGANYPTLRTEEAFPLTIEHEYIACYNSSNISFTLPSPTVAHKGKRYQFKRCKGGQVTVHGTIFKNDVATNTPVGAGVGDVATFQNDGMYWCYSFQGC